LVGSTLSMPCFSLHMVTSCVGYEAKCCPYHHMAHQWNPAPRSFKPLRPGVSRRFFDGEKTSRPPRLLCIFSIFLGAAGGQQNRAFLAGWGVRGPWYFAFGSWGQGCTHPSANPPGGSIKPPISRLPDAEVPHLGRGLQEKLAMCKVVSLLDQTLLGVEGIFRLVMLFAERIRMCDYQTTPWGS
jgi:hypothetical protein